MPKQTKMSRFFTDYLISNSEGELLVAKVENTNFWVTPGLYQNNEQTIRQGLDSIAMTYGLEIDNIKLKGSFVLKRDLNGEISSSLRNVYTANLTGGEQNKPKGIEEIRWLSMKQALELITFPHINIMIEQIMNKPDQIWGGTLMQFKEDDIWKVKVLEDFYTL